MMDLPTITQYSITTARVLVVVSGLDWFGGYSLSLNVVMCATRRWGYIVTDCYIRDCPLSLDVPNMVLLSVLVV